MCWKRYFRTPLCYPGNHCCVCQAQCFYLRKLTTLVITRSKMQRTKQSNRQSTVVVLHADHDVTPLQIFKSENQSKCKGLKSWLSNFPLSDNKSVNFASFSRKWIIQCKTEYWSTFSFTLSNLSSLSNTSLTSTGNNIKIRSSFLVINKAGNVDINYVLLKFENMLDTVINHINLNSKHHVKCKFALKFIKLVFITN